MLCGVLLMTLYVSGAISDETAPDIQRIILNNIAHFDPIEASLRADKGEDPPEIGLPLKESKLEFSNMNRLVQTNLFGRAWQTCVRTVRGKNIRTLAVFVVQNRVIEVRTAIIPDGCDALDYQSSR
jgi:hypothetical protein